MKHIRKSIALASLALCGCRAGIDPPNSSVQRPEAYTVLSTSRAQVSDTKASDADGNPQVSYFDCDKASEEAETRCGQEIGDRPHGLRSFELGGPEGTAFNTYALRCRVVVALGCKGSAELRLFVGNQLIERIENMPQTQGLACDLSLPMAVVRGEFDVRSDLVYDTAILRAELSQQCGDPPYVARASDSFVAGFSSGE